MKDQPNVIPSKAARKSIEINDNLKSTILHQLEGRRQSRLSNLKVLGSFNQIKRTLVEIFSLKSFTLHWLSFAAIFGTFSAFYVIMNQVLKPSLKKTINNHHGNENWMIAIGGFIMEIMGFSGSILGGYLLDKFSKYKFQNVVSSSMVLVIFVILTSTMKQAIIGLIFFLFAFFGLFMGAYGTSAIQFAFEISYPHSEAIITILFLTGMQISGTIIAAIGQKLLDMSMSTDPSRGALNTCLLMIGMMVVGIILALLTKEELNRNKASNNSTRRNSNASVQQDNTNLPGI